MARILAIDYGQKRVGIAATDENIIIATPLITLPAAQTIDWVVNYIKTEQVGTIVVGKAVDMKGNASDASRFIEPFVNRLRNALKDKNIEIVRMDERFTSVMARQALIEAGVSNKVRKDKGIVDKVSATIILQSYMQMLTNRNR
ncbi:MAG: Holliday junction resolvase RuvX [Bacteroidales bacterium]|jgi:putative Holliday junction resolvase|nr:Holliday junction resolvase RuvX [Bacteroidales bacterium]